MHNCYSNHAIMHGQSNYISRCKFSFYFVKKSYFFLLYTLIFTKHQRQFIILHIYLIKYSFFYNFLLFSPSPLFSHKPNPKGSKPISFRTTLSLSLSHRPKRPPHKPSNFSFDEALVHHVIHHVVHHVVHHVIHRLVASVGFEG